MNARLVSLLDALLKLTSKQKIEWSRIAEGRYRWEGEAGSVTVFFENPENRALVDIQDWRDSTTFLATVQDPERKPVLTVTHQEVPEVKDLFETVRRRLFLVDEVVELLLKEVVQLDD